MINYYNEISALFDVYENEEHLTEREIYQRCLLLIKKHNFDRDYMFSVNDVINNRGYCFQFEVPSNRVAEFVSDEYIASITNASKSKNKTAELINYLNKIKDHRLAFASIHALKVKLLVELGVLPSDSEFINSRLNWNLRDLLFESFDDNDDIRELLISALEKIGFDYVILPYFRFWLDMEYLLWFIERADSRKGHIKVNTIKVAFGIAPRIYFERGDKKYYDVSFSKKLNSYLKLIDKRALAHVKEKYKGSVEPTRLYGYSLLFNVL